MKIAAFLVFCFFLAGCTQNNASYAQEQIQQTPSENQLCLENTCIEIERAITTQEHARGLMFRESLCEECGMLFVFQDEQPRTFWMKNTLIPLDIIWMNSQKEITGISEAMPCTSDPCKTYSPQGNAKYVLEVNAGFSQRNDLGAGSKLEFRG